MINKTSYLFPYLHLQTADLQRGREHADFHWYSLRPRRRSSDLRAGPRMRKAGRS